MSLIKLLQKTTKSCIITPLKPEPPTLHINNPYLIQNQHQQLSQFYVDKNPKEKYVI